MTKRLEEVRIASAPPKKFTFKKSIRPTTVPSLGSPMQPPATETLSTSNKDVKETDTGPSMLEPSSVLSPVTQAPAGFELSSLDTTHYVLKSSSSYEASTASLVNVERSAVDISVTPATRVSFASLTVANIRKSLLICGTIAGPAHITAVEDSTIVIIARQLRLHNCKNLVAYLRCSSRPIIEDCKETRFAPLPVIFVSYFDTARLGSQ